MLGSSDQMTISTSVQKRDDNHAGARGFREVLVGIVTRNRCRLLPKAIESSLSQGYQQLLVAVLDDGSDDDTPQLRSKYPAVRWIRWEQSSGYLEARNYLMRDSDADFYFSLADDAWFLNGDEIVIAAQYMEMNPKVAA